MFLMNNLEISSGGKVKLTWYPFAAIVVVFSEESTFLGFGCLVDRLHKSEVVMIRRCSELPKVVMSAESGLSFRDPQIGGAERDPACACILNRPWLKKASELSFMVNFSML